MNIRKVALDLFCSWEDNAQYINLAIGRACNTLPTQDRRFLTALLYGTIEHLLTLRYDLGILAKRSNMDPTTKDLLTLALYELLYMKTKNYATINEWAGLGRNKGEKGFINAILRTADREPELLTLPEKSKDPARFYSIKYSIPKPTIRILSALLGPELEAFLNATTGDSSTTLCINTGKISRDHYLELLNEQELRAEKTTYAPTGIRLLDPLPVTSLPGFLEGYFFVQDEASQLETFYLDAKPNMRVLDACACPGGKSFGAAIQMGNTGTIRSCDLHASKLSLIEEGAKRLGITTLQVEERDSSIPVPSEQGLYDRIICDVPCSGLGVFSKKPDLRYKDFSNLEDLPKLQYSILEAVSQALAPEGLLVYSTCTITPEENSAVLARFLSEHSDFEIEPLCFDGQTLPYLALFPHIHHTDGFFIAKIKRKTLS